MNRQLSAIALAALCAVSLPLCAQDAPPQDGPPPGGHGGPGGKHRPLPPIIAALDANHDGVIDADEIANAVAVLKTLDKNKDGKLTHDELRPAHPPGGPAGGPPDGDPAGGPPDGGPAGGPPDGGPAGGPPDDGNPPPPQDGPGGPGGPDGRPPEPPILAALDANHDGVIDASEIANAVAALKTLDKNNDGKLTQDELRPAHPGRPEHGNRRPRPSSGQ